MTTSYTPGLYARAAGPGSEAVAGVTEARIRELVDEFYRRAQEDVVLGPIFAEHIDDWDRHLGRMVDFWSAVMRGTGRYQGRPVQVHQGIDGLTGGHFDRWVTLFEATTRDICSPAEAEAFLERARRMREAMTRSLGLVGPEARLDSEGS